jgi:basic membrane protein A
VRALPAVANEFPDQNYAQIDSRPRLEPSDPGNAAVLGLVFNQEQISALAGVLSALVAAHHDFERVGIVLGREIAVLYDFEMGFKWGVDWGLAWLERNHPEALRGKKIAALKRQERVLWTYVGVWDDPAKGKTATQVQIRQGAGIVYQVAGGTGLGVLAAVDDAHKAGAIPIGKPPFAIGVDAVQDWINPHILASGIKRVDTAVFTAIKLAMDGTFRETIAKNNGRLALNLTNGGVALSNEEMLANTLDFAKSAARIREDQFPTILANYRKLRGEQPAHVWRALDQLADAIKAGSAEIPRPSADPQKYDIKQLREQYG